MQTQMNNRFKEEIVIFLTYKYKGNTTSDTFSPDFLSFSAIYSLLLPHITHGKPSHLPMIKPSWIFLALTEYVYNYRPTALLPCRLCTAPMATLMAFQTSLPGI